MSLLILLLSITGEVIFIDSPDTNLIDLKYSPVIANSDTVWIEGIIQKRGVDYTLDYNRGLLKFNRTPDEIIKIKFSHPDFSIDSVYRLWTPEEIDSSGSKLIKEDSTLRDSGAVKGLTINGNKGLFMEVSERGTGITQSLWLRLGGRAGDYKIQGVLSDENLPEEGESRRLKEIDEIYIEAISEKSSFRVGDIDVVHQDVEKEILGLTANWENVFGMAGLSESKYGKCTFRTNQGKQGPYRLFLENQRSSEFSIVHGSERIYLNGKLLKRGDEKDYTMDYYNGAVIFNPSIYLDNETTVLALFEYHPFGGDNIFYKGGIRTGDAEISLTRQRDITTSQSFDEVYPDSGYAYVYSATYVGPGNGDYNLEDSIFVYQEDREGSYLVYFNWVGEGDGEYVYIDSLHSFRWEEGGSWSARKRVPLPAVDNLLSLSLEKELKYFYFKGLADARMYESMYGPGDKKGVSGNFNFEYTPVKWLKLDSKYIRRTRNFKNLEWNAPVDLLKSWEIESLPSNYSTVSLEVRPADRFNSSYTWARAGRLKKDRISLWFSPVYVKWENIWKRRMDFEGGIRWHQYSLFYHQINRDSTYRREVFLEGKPLTAGIGIDGAGEEDTTISYIVKTDFSPGKSRIKGSFTRKKDVRTGEVSTITNIFGRTDIQMWFLKVDALAGISRKQSPGWERYFREVNPGEGNYSYDSEEDEYYEDPYGDYVLVTVPTGEFLNVEEYKLTSSFNSNRYFFLHGYVDFTFRPELYIENNSSILLKFPEESKKRFLISYDRQLLYNDQVGVSGRKRRNEELLIGYEYQDNGSSEVGLKGERNLYEYSYGLYSRIWRKEGLEFFSEVSRIMGKDTLYNLRVEPGLHLYGDKVSGNIGFTLGYNYYDGEDYNSSRMGNIYPRGFFYGFRTSVRYKLPGDFDIVINGNLNKMGEEKIYYRGRFGVTADFGN